MPAGLVVCFTTRVVASAAVVALPVPSPWLVQ